MREEGYSLKHLVPDRKMPVAVSRVECLVIAVRTTAMPNLTVPVGTSKATIKRYLLHLATEDAPQIRTELIIIKSTFAHICAKIQQIVLTSKDQPSALRLRKSLGVTPVMRL